LIMTIINQITSFKISVFSYNGTDTQLNYTAGVTAGTAQPSKALVLNSSSNITSGINSLTSTSLVTTNLTVNGTSFTNSIITNLNALDSVTAGTASASKALIVDGSRNINNINILGATTLNGTLGTAAQTNITSVGTLTGLTSAGNVNISQHNGTTTGLQLNSVLVTSSAAELNRLTGILSTTAELNKLFGVTATTSEFNKLAGLTPTTAELNKLSGVTATTNQLNFVSGVNAGTVSASKAIVVDGSRNITNMGSITSTSDITLSTGRLWLANTNYGLSHKYTTGGSAEIITATDGIDNNTIGTFTDNDFSLTVNNTRYLTIKKTTGRVGINSTSPNMQLEVNSHSGNVLRLFNSGGNSYMDVTINNQGLTTLSLSGTSPSFSLSHAVSITSNTASTNTTTGALIVAGGAGIGGAVNIGSTLSVTGNITGTLATAAQPNITSTGDLTIPSSLTINNGSTPLTLTNTTSNSIFTLTIQNAGGAIDLRASGTNQISLFTNSTRQLICNGTTVNIPIHNGSTTGLALNGTLVTATATELNYNDITTIGTAEASKALIVDSSRNIININGLTATTLTGTLATANQSAITTVGTLTGLTSSGAVSITNNTASSSTSTGALIVTGGVGIGGAINVGSSSSIAGSLALTPTTKVIAVGITSTNCLWHSTTSRFYGMRQIDGDNISMLSYSASGTYNDYILWNHNGGTSLLDINAHTNVNSLQIGTSTDTTRFISALDGITTAGSIRYITFGSANTAGNQAEFTHTYQGDNNASNLLSLGHHSNNQILNIFNGGNVSIGRISPQSRFDIQGSATYVSGSFNRILSAFGTNASPVQFEIQVSTGTNATTTNAAWFGTFTNNDLRFGTNNGTRMTLSAAGNLGISNVTPTYKLDVSGDINLTGSLRFSGTAITSTVSELNILSGVTATAAQINYLAGTTLGTITASKAITVDASSNINSILRLTKSANGNQILFTNGTSTGAIYQFNNGNLWFGTTSSNDTVLQSNGSERMRILSSGNVGIGTTAPSYALDVNGTIQTNTLIYNNLGPGASARFVGNWSANNFWGIGPHDTSTGTTYRIRIGINDIAGAWSGAYPVVYTGGLNLQNNTASTSTTTGTIVVTGGVGISGAVNIGGALSKGSGTFDIEHPTLSNKRLVHSFIEGPRCDLIYRGTVKLVNGMATVNLDKESVANQSNSMTEGTFVALVQNPVCYLQNSTFDRVIGIIENNKLKITCENNTSSSLVNWMVIGERKDKFIKEWNRTDNNGCLITEYTI
jgi:hypothetical protein